MRFRPLRPLRHLLHHDQDAGEYADVPGFCKSATTDEINAHGNVLTPGRYVGAEELEEDDEPFDEKMQRLVTTLNEQFAESAKLESQIRSNLHALCLGATAALAKCDFPVSKTVCSGPTRCDQRQSVV